ncbi:hypothetical protein [Roseateles amylovorans]|uniref:Uncharacterized protein n=1 Tax=Roseateles amylovorans TaxID=2978473 RepID=A0ABY6AV08_9BURK|nr:hypothetical protein [Roseateles amylovorans]UXH76763.1 hypothetical protein N4261_17200 [Roseateles amylovorans]
MSARRFNAIADLDTALAEVDAVLLPLGFERIEHVYHRRSDDDLLPRLQAVTLGFAYGFRTCWLQVTVKVPTLVELLSQVRPFAYAKAHAWRVPDYASHLACMLRLSDLPGAVGSPLPPGLQWREDGRLQRARWVTAQTLGATLAGLIQQQALPALAQRLTLHGLAAAADAPGFERSGIAGAWALAARLALGDLEGAARAFRAHPCALGADRARFAAATRWLRGCGVDVDDLAWPQPIAATQDPWDSQPWLSGDLVGLGAQTNPPT